MIGHKFIWVFLVFFVFLTGCTGGLLSLSEEDEVKVGEQVSKQIEKEHKLWDNPQALARVVRLGDEMARQAERKFKYSFKLLDMKEENAFALPGGFIYVTSGLMKSELTDDQLAGVMAHEITHVDHRHYAGRFKREQTQNIIAVAVMILTKGGSQDVLKGASILNDLVFESHYSRAQEADADDGAVKMMVRVGRNPYAMADLFESWKQKKTGSNWIPNWARSHPAYDERISRIREQAKLHGAVPPAAGSAPPPRPVTTPSAEQEKGFANETPAPVPTPATAPGAPGKPALEGYRVKGVRKESTWLLQAMGPNPIKTVEYRLLDGNGNSLASAVTSAPPFAEEIKAPIQVVFVKVIVTEQGGKSEFMIPTDRIEWVSEL